MLVSTAEGAEDVEGNAEISSHGRPGLTKKVCATLGKELRPLFVVLSPLLVRALKVYFSLDSLAARSLTYWTENRPVI